MVQRYNPDYAMHAARFEPFAREAEHGEYVRFDAHQQEVSTLNAERDALQAKGENLEKQISHINTQSLEGALKMADAIKELTDRVERLSGMLTESRVATKSAEERADALAVENQELKDVFGPGEAVVNFLSIALRHTKYDRIDLPDVALAFKMSLPETPATDAALAAIQAQAIEDAVKKVLFVDTVASTVVISQLLRAYAAALREAK